jgi:hypothetical protein
LSELAWSAGALCFTRGAASEDCIPDMGISDHLPVAATISFYDFASTVSIPPSETPVPVVGCSYERTPAQIPDDSFEGGVLRTTQWTVDSYGQGTVTQDGRLVASTGDAEASSGARIVSRGTLTGDFDIRVEFEIGEGWGAPDTGHLDGAYLGVIISGQRYHITRLRRSGTSDGVFMIWSSTGTPYAEVDTTALAGAYRIVRSGTSLSVQYDVGAGWTEIASATVSDEQARVYMGNGSVSAYHAFTSYLDNFVTN